DTDDNADQTFEVHFVHKTEPVTPDKPGNTDMNELVHKVTQTVHYVDKDGKPVADDVTDEVTFQREGTRDLVTGEVTFGDWEAVDDDDTFDAKKSPVIDGYYADRTQVDASTVTADSDNQEINVVYNKLGSLIPDVPGVDPVPYPNDPTDPTKPGQPVIPDIPGYTPVDPNTNKPLTPGEEYPIDPNKPGEDTHIHYEANQQKATVTYIDDKTGQTIHTENLIGKGGTKSDYTTADKIAELEQQGYELVSNNFPADGLTFDTDDNADQTFEVHFVHKTVPVTPDKPGEPGKPVDPSNPDGPKYPDGTDVDSLVHKVTQTVHYVDKDGKKLADDVTDEVTFERTGTVDLVTGEVTYTEWKAVDDDDTFDAKKSPVIDGYYADRAQVDASTVEHDSDNQEVNVTYNKLGNLVPDAPGVDPVPYPNDPTDPTKPGQPVIPDVPGYTPVDPDNNPLKPGDKYPIDPNKPGEDTDIHYVPDKVENDQKAEVHFIDDVTGKDIHVEHLTGKPGTTSDYTTADKITELEKQGYELVKDNYPADGLVFDNDDNADQMIEVHFKHKTVPVTPDKPGEPGKPVDPSNPDGPKYPDGTDVNSLVHKVTQTIHYVDQNGNKLADDVTDEVTFERTGTVDLVTGDVTYTDWKAVNDDNTFDAKVSPVINGYYADRAQVDAVTVTADMDNQEVNVIYHAMGHLIPDVPGVDPVPYPNDPTDPTKPGQPTIPNVPGYTPVDPDGNPLKPGDKYPIDPENPGSDTHIHYEPNKVVPTPDDNNGHVDDNSNNNGQNDGDNNQNNGDNGQNNDQTSQSDESKPNAEAEEQQSTNKEDMNKLPQTGAATDHSSLVGGVLLAVAGALQLDGLFKKRKKED
ncbi:MAG: MucBP domain-containing protein, partial [Aerococcus sp.]|nr:MucBP domain-containing protein [Aerococcus sp.]